MEKIDIDVGLPRLPVELYLQYHRERGLEWGWRRR